MEGHELQFLHQCFVEVGVAAVIYSGFEARGLERPAQTSEKLRNLSLLSPCSFDSLHAFIFRCMYLNCYIGISLVAVVLSGVCVCVCV